MAGRSSKNGAGDCEKTREELMRELESLRLDLKTLRHGGRGVDEAANRDRNFLEALVSSFPGVFYLFDERGRLHRWNRKLEEITGYTSGEISVMSVMDFVNPAKRHEAEEKIHEAFIRGQAEMEAELLCKGGARVPFIFSGASVTIGGVGYIIGVGIDVTESKKTEEALRNARAGLEAKVQERTRELIEANRALQDEFHERERTEETLHAILKGTSSLAGRDFLYSLVEHLAMALGFRFAFVGVYDEKTESVRTRALWADGRIGENFTYPLAGTPCQNVVGNEICLYPEGVRELFPEDHLLTEMGVESYIGVPLFDGKGKPLGLLAALDDKKLTDVVRVRELISIFANRAAVELERTWLTDALVGQSRRLDAFFAHTLNPTVFLDREFNFIMVSDSYASACGLSPEDLEGRNLFEMFPTDIKKFFETVVETKKPYSATSTPFTFPTHPEWGVTYWDWSLVPVLDASGDVDFLVLSSSDVTERKRAEEALRMSEEKYRSLFEDFKDIIFVTTPEGRIIDINPAGMEILRFNSMEEVMSANVEDLYQDPSDRDRFRQMMEEQGFVRDFETTATRRDGTRLDLLITANALTDEHGEIVAYRGIAHDLSEHKRLERQLIQAQKMEAVGQLTGGIAHDFNNLMTIVTSFSNLAMREAVSDAQKGYIDQIRAASIRASNLTRQLLIFSRKQPLEIGVMNINSSVSGMLEILDRLVSENITIAMELSPDISPVRGDKSNMEQLILNLVVNARDAMPEGGRITVRTENVEIGEGRKVASGTLEPGRYVALTVEDSGHGMADDVLPRIFEPFYSTKAAGKGIGLGLAVVQSILKEHKASIDVDSEPGRGSSFTVYLPAVEDAALEREDEGREGEAVEEAKGMGERILVVEDEMWLRKSVSLVLSKSGYKVFEAANARDAQSLFESEGGKFDLVFSDLMLEDMDGAKLAESLIRARPGLSVVLTSGYMDVDEQWPAIRQKGFRFLQKPFEPPELLRTVRQALSREEG